MKSRVSIGLRCLLIGVSISMVRWSAPGALFGGVLARAALTASAVNGLSLSSLSSVKGGRRGRWIVGFGDVHVVLASDKSCPANTVSR